MITISKIYKIRKIDKNNNNIYQTMWLDIFYHIKYKYSPKHKAVYNCAIPYLTVLMIIGLEILNYPKNNQTDP